MLPWVHIDTSEIPGGEGSLRLLSRGTEFAIFLDKDELMNSRRSASEEALATLTCTRLAHQPKARVLIGGLGMGFTLSAALATLGKDAEVRVAELVPAVAEWARGPLAHIIGGSLDDPRVTLEVADVGRLIGEAASLYDAILLDVDNGPDGLTRAANDRLYGSNGLNAAYAALRPEGVLAIWSSAPDSAFVQRLRRSSFDVKEVKARAHAGKGGHHLIWLATKAGS
ncbi:MAG: spermidine synthase [Sphingomonadaceae bacterium]